MKIIYSRNIISVMKYLKCFAKLFDFKYDKNFKTLNSLVTKSKHLNFYGKNQSYMSWRNRIEDHNFCFYKIYWKLQAQQNS